jgi:hypothetical protein
LKGCLALLLGGKNVGKSTVLTALAKEKNSLPDFLVLYVVTRYCPGRLELGLENGVAQLVAEQITQGVGLKCTK